MGNGREDHHGAEGSIPQADMMRLAYADPVYLKQSRHYKEHLEASLWDKPDAHYWFARSLLSHYPDGWALSCSVPSLSLYMQAVPSARICAWVKPFAIFKPNVGLAYTWEPVLVYGGRKRTRSEPTCRDHLVENITLKKGLVGAKPLRFMQWILGLLNWQKDDALVDIFPGTGIMAEALSIGKQDLGGPRK